MLGNYLKISFRTISRSQANTLINVAGVALGLAYVLLISSVVSYHLGIDNFHRNSDLIYRFVTDQHRDQISYAEGVPPAFGNAFREDYSFGEKVARVCTLDGRLITLEKDNQVQKFR